MEISRKRKTLAIDDTLDSDRDVEITIEHDDNDIDDSYIYINEEQAIKIVKHLSSLFKI